MGERVRITDVSPRDGLQNEPGVIASTDKVRLVEMLSRAGVDEIEVTSFVSPKWVPQLGDASAVCAALAANRPRGVVLSALVPNEKGMAGAIAANARVRVIDKVSVFTAASETFAEKNTGASITQTLERFVPVIASANAAGLLVRGYVSCVIACPFEGAIEPAKVAQVAASLVDLGVDEIDLGDTIGVGTRDTTKAMLDAVLTRIGAPWLDGRSTGERGLTLHLHDTHGRAPECVRVALELGVRSFDGSVAGLGGCPYASTPGRRAPGNISTESLVRTVHEAGFATGVNAAALAEAAAFASAIVSTARAGAPA